ncbi:hypothetical protein [Nocardioides sp.]|uniref:hypothetical protein n=1 Tax=Nocardioides sp. TaxID=35761 RepID=UPI003529450F
MAALPAQEVLAAPTLLHRPVLAAAAASTAPCEVTLRVAAPSRVVHAEVRVRTADGSSVVRRLRLRPGHPAVVVLTDLYPGTATWVVRGRQGLAIADRGGSR